MSDLPVLGCAMELHNLENLAPWVLEKDRDLEIQDAYHAFVLDKTADKVADRVRELLGDGYKGRLGIHGPFYGLSLDNVDPAIRKVVKMRLEQALRIILLTSYLSGPLLMPPSLRVVTMPVLRSSSEATTMSCTALSSMTPESMTLACMPLLLLLNTKTL